MNNYEYDLIVIGGGGGGITSVMLANGLGKKAAMIDKAKFGGECTWSGCVPSKALIQSAKAAHLLDDLKKYGLSLPSKTTINSTKVMESVRNVITSVYNEEKPGHFEDLGITAIEDAEIAFLDSHTVQVNTNRLSAARFVIATGSSPVVPPIKGIKEVKHLTNENLFFLKKIPKSLVVIGAGPIGLEMASAFQRLGSNVTVIEMAEVILFREDLELTGMLHKKLVAEGINIITGAAVEKVEGKGKITVHYSLEGKSAKVTADELFIAAGRTPNIEGLNLEKAGVEYTKKGIITNNLMQTSAKNIYAIGDVVGPYQFSHMANYQGILATSNALLPINKKADYSNVPWITFTDPELARSGVTEKEATEKYGKKLRIFKAHYREIDRGRTDRIETGMAKVLCAPNGNIVGIHILGERAGELMQELHLAKTLNIPLHKLNDVLHAYPAYSDLIKKLARDAYVDKIQNSILVKIIKMIKGSK